MRTAVPTRCLRLAPHVRACACGDQTILLDLLGNRYLGFGATASKALESLIRGWPVASASATTNPSPVATTDLTQRLLAQGLIVETQWDVDVAEAANEGIAEAIASLGADDRLTDIKLGARRVANFLCSAAITSWWLRRRSLDSITKIVAMRRARFSGTVSDSLDSMRAGTAAYERLRPFVFTARDQCLYDSLALLSFLAAERLFPRWVVGVKTCPFGAHSWLQSGGTVVNDHHEYVRRFRPILVV